MTARTAVRIVTVLLALAFIAAFALSVSAHADGGADEPFIAPDMNQPSYWETRFGADCTKYENHSGSIPSWVDIAIVHDGQKVRVYNPAPSFVLGPQNTQGNNANKDVHYGAPHSWVMKCTVSTTTTAPTTTTTEQQTTTTFVEDTTTTAVEPTTTTTQVDSSSTTIGQTTTTQGGDTTTSEPPASTTTTGLTPAELPFTGAATGLLTVIAAGLIIVGLGLIARREP